MSIKNANYCSRFEENDKTWNHKYVFHRTCTKKEYFSVKTRESVVLAVKEGTIWSTHGSFRVCAVSYQKKISFSQRNYQKAALISFQNQINSETSTYWCCSKRNFFLAVPCRKILMHVNIYFKLWKITCFVNVKMLKVLIFFYFIKLIIITYYDSNNHKQTAKDKNFIGNRIRQKHECN